jgi:hypothetical protein
VGSPGSQHPADDRLPLPSKAASTTVPMPTAEFHPLQVMSCSCRAPNAGQRSPAWDGGRLPAGTEPGRHHGQQTGSSRRPDARARCGRGPVATRHQQQVAGGSRAQRARRGYRWTGRRRWRRFGSNSTVASEARPGYFAASWASRPAGVREPGPRVANATSRRPSCRSRRRGRLVWATPSGGGRRVGRCAGRCAERPYEIRTWLPPLFSK